MNRSPEPFHRKPGKITDFFPSTPHRNRGEERCASPEDQDQSMFPSTSTRLLSIQTPKKKRARFTDQELHALVDTILQNIEQLFGSKKLNAASKAAVWDTAVQKVNDKGGMKRTLLECKKRWSDYKVKVKKKVAAAKLKSSEDGNEEPWTDMLSQRELNVARFYKWDTESTDVIHVSDESRDTGKVDSEDDDNGLCEVIPIESMQVKHPQEESHPQSSEAVSGQPSNYSKAKLPQVVQEPTSTQPCHQQLPQSELDQIIAQQKQTNEILKSMQESVSASMQMQKKINRIIKTNFIELQKSMMSIQKKSNEQNGALERTIKSLHDKIDDIKIQLQEKRLQDLMNSDDSDLEGSSPLTRETSPLNKVSKSAQRKTLDPSTAHGPSQKKRKKNDK
ncbi:myb/SANT-like DNA-binding domain-containing protein 4 [Hyperolius riggenbachi]|uniref:myb/SANT-like DNA-binding domain-containing protein 4 n=1 Tax=Hyperolius riggenbachi TaxID=752182 RepID=UPI0035A29AED